VRIPHPTVMMVAMDDVDVLPEPELPAAARRADPAAFEELVDGHRRELYAHCYRMLGSVQDAEDGLQESLLAAWRGLSGFEGSRSPSSKRALAATSWSSAAAPSGTICSPPASSTNST
jgi:hypothetical protein